MIKGYIIEKYGVNNYSKFLFLIKGAIISIFIYLISDYTPIRIFTAKIVQKGITYFGIEKSLIISKKYVAIGNYEISKRCIGLASGAIFSALFLLSSLKLSKKILYLSLFLLILLFLNIMRLMVTIYLLNKVTVGLLHMIYLHTYSGLAFHF